VTAVLLAFAFACVAATGGFASEPNPQAAAAVLVSRLKTESEHAHDQAFGASRVVARSGGLWLAFGSTAAIAPLQSGTEPTRVEIYRWSRARWELAGVVSGPLGPSQWIYPVALTGSRDPDFAIEGCGAADTNCLSIVSDIGGRWHAIPFEYGYGTSLEVNGIPAGEFGLPAGRFVETAVDACSCAGGPSTFTDESFHNGMFEPVFGPGQHPDCSPKWLATVADPAEVQVLGFARVACAGGWALAIGTGAGFSGPVIGLFDRAYHKNAWQVLTLDNGTALPAAPAIYDLPLSLLVQLGSRLGSSLAPEVAAAKLIADLQAHYHFYWPQQDGVVVAGGSSWLIAPVPARPAPNAYSPYPATAIIYRWNGTSWTVAGRIAHLPSAMNIDWVGGWFTATSASTPAIAFKVAGSQSKSTSIVTNAGGTWHVQPSRQRRSL
jgi:hypothetical protein